MRNGEETVNYTGSGPSGVSTWKPAGANGAGIRKCPAHGRVLRTGAAWRLAAYNRALHTVSGPARVLLGRPGMHSVFRSN